MTRGSGKTKTGGELSRMLATLTSSDMISALANMADLGEELESGISDFSPQETGTLIKLQSERLARMIDSLVIAEQVREGSYQLQTQPLILRPVLEGVINDLVPLSGRYQTGLRMGRKRAHRPVLADINLLSTILKSTLEAVVRTTASKKVKVETVSHDDRLFVHITDKDVSDEGARPGNQALIVPSFFVASSLLKAMNGELRIAATKQQRHIDLVLPHSVQLAMELK